jgi:hypothetical protein
MFKFLHARRQKAGESSSHVLSTLERIRDMREHSQWEPLTQPATVRERTDRLAETREHIKVPPLANEREPWKALQPYFKSPEFLRSVLYPIVVFLGVALALYAFGPEFTIKSQIRQASFVYPGMAYSNLTESDAERIARRSLASTGLDSSQWHKLLCDTDGGAMVIYFRYEDDRSTIVRVKVQLEPGERILCTIEPR